MNKKVGIFFLVLTFSLIYPSLAEAKFKKVRTITVCALIDKESPIPFSLVKKIVRRASNDYSRNVGIQLRLIKIKMTSLDTLNESLVLDFKKEGESANIVAVFSNKVKVVYFRVPGLRMGFSDEEYGVIWNYMTAFRLSYGCYLNTHKVFEHEIAHLFGAKHNDTEVGSFMNAHSERCPRKWPPILKSEILKNKYRQWPITSQ